jgi:hypothetical protein
MIEKAAAQELKPRPREPVARRRREPRADGAAPQALLAGLGTPDRKGL